MKKTFISLLALILLAVGVVATTPQAEARTSVSEARLASLEAQVAQLLLILQQLRAQQSRGYYTPVHTSNGSADVRVFTSGVDDVGRNEVTLEGKVDFRNEDEATVWFNYGRSRTNLNEETIFVVLDEDDDDERFSQRIDDLKRDTTYYFQAVAEDEDGDRTFGSVHSFKTDRSGSSSNDDDEPEVDTEDADDVDENSAELNGSVDMNDFNNGLVFFVYGEDEDQVEDIADDYDEYDDIDEDGDDLQKVKVDNDLDGDDSYSEDISGLDDDTDIYFVICVEYEDEDDDEVLECGQVEDFETDQD